MLRGTWVTGVRMRRICSSGRHRCNGLGFPACRNLPRSLRRPIRTSPRFVRSVMRPGHSGLSQSLPLESRSNPARNSSSDGVPERLPQYVQLTTPARGRVRLALLGVSLAQKGSIPDSSALVAFDLSPKALGSIEPLILTVRGTRVILASDLAAIYGVETKVLNQAVKRNADRFPPDFAFRLPREVAADLHRSRVAA